MHRQSLVSAEARKSMPPLFDRFTAGCAGFAGRPLMFFLCMLLAGLVVVALASDDEILISRAHLAISLLTLLLLPVLQAAQNRDGAALQAKLDELIKASSSARNAMIGLENRSGDEIEELRMDEETRR